MFGLWRDKGLLTLPHWATHHTFISNIYSHIRTTLKPTSKKFFKYRLEANLDNLDMFTNEYLDWVFLLDEDPSSSGGSGDQGETGSRGSGNTPLLELSFLVISAVLSRFLGTH